MPELTSGTTLGFLLTDSARLYRQFFERKVTEAGLGLTPGEIRALWHVIRARGSRQAVLADRMGVEPMTLSAYLDRLEVQALIERRMDPSDRRAKIVEPTAAALRMMNELGPLFKDIYTHVTKGMSEVQVRAMADGLSALRSNLTNEPVELPDPRPVDGSADAAGAATGKVA